MFLLPFLKFVAPLVVVDLFLDRFFLACLFIDGNYIDDLLLVSLDLLLLLMHRNDSVREDKYNCEITVI
jgi:hypothetical protein